MAIQSPARRCRRSLLMGGRLRKRGAWRRRRSRFAWTSIARRAGRFHHLIATRVAAFGSWCQSSAPAHDTAAGCFRQAGHPRAGARRLHRGSVPGKPSLSAPSNRPDKTRDCAGACRRSSAWNTGRHPEASPNLASGLPRIALTPTRHPAHLGRILQESPVVGWAPGAGFAQSRQRRRCRMQASRGYSTCWSWRRGVAQAHDGNASSGSSSRCQFCPPPADPARGVMCFHNSGPGGRTQASVQ